MWSIKENGKQLEKIWHIIRHKNQDKYRKITELSLKRLKKCRQTAKKINTRKGKNSKVISNDSKKKKNRLEKIQKINKIITE